MHRRSFLLASASLSAALVFPISAFAADKAGYEALIKEVIKAAASKSVADIDGLIAKLDKAAAIGADFCKEVAAKDAKNKPILDFTAASIEKMRATSSTDFEEQWHEGKAFKAAGHDINLLDQTGMAASATDSIIHPLTARAALVAYKTAPSPELLKTVVEELEEVLGHLTHL